MSRRLLVIPVVDPVQFSDASREIDALQAVFGMMPITLTVKDIRILTAMQQAASDSRVYTTLLEKLTAHTEVIIRLEV